MIHREIDINSPLTDAQIAMLQALEARREKPDDDCPELTQTQLLQFRHAKKSKKSGNSNLSHRSQSDDYSFP